jgi:hypothetical protein
MSGIKKNILFFFLTVVYVTSVSGITFHKHFCEGELEAISIIKNSSCCEGETEEAADDCCSNEISVLINQSDAFSVAKWETKIKISSNNFVFYSCANLSLSNYFAQNKFSFSQFSPWRNFRSEKNMVLRI